MRIASTTAAADGAEVIRISEFGGAGRSPSTGAPITIILGAATNEPHMRKAWRTARGVNPGPSTSTRNSAAAMSCWAVAVLSANRDV